VAAFTQEQIEQSAKDILVEFEDGFQFADIFKLVPKAMKIVEQVQGMSSEDKKTTAINLIDYVLDHVDVPGPDFIVTPIIKAVAPYVIEVIIAASKGEFGINVKS